MTDADTEAGRGEGREAFEVELRDLAERMLDRGKENEGNAVMVMADKLERLRQSDPGREPVAWRARYEGEEEWRFLGWPPSHDQYEEVQPLYAAPTDEAPEVDCICHEPLEEGLYCPEHWSGGAEEARRLNRSPPVEEGDRGEDFTQRMLRQVLEASQKHEPITLGTAHEEALQDAIDRLQDTLEGETDDRR